jgi:hypothetical protein
LGKKERKKERNRGLLIMVQKTVLKVDISCQKCKTKVLKAVSALEGKPYIHFVLH